MLIFGIVAMLLVSIPVTLIAQRYVSVSLFAAVVTGLLGVFTLFVLPPHLRGWFATQLYRIALLGGVLLVLSSGLFLGLLIRRFLQGRRHDH